MDYNNLICELKNLPQDFKLKVIGKTKLKRKIFAVERILNKSFSTAIFIASVHARENITTDLVMKMIKEGLFNKILEFNVVIIPMVNPDGVELEINGLDSVSKKHHSRLIKMNDGSADFTFWKSNARGVDINNNFDAKFGTNVHATKPSSSGFIGKRANSEIETRAVVNYTNKVNPFITVSYHSKGEEIYFNFFQSSKRLERDEKIAEEFAKSTGYKIKNVEKLSSGGYKDWCVNKLKIPALTIEVGDDDWKHPIGIEKLESIFDKNKNVASDVQFAYNVFKEYQNDI